MTLLQIMPDDQPGTVLVRTDNVAIIDAALKARGIALARWPRCPELDPRSDQEEVLAAYVEEIDELKARGGYQLVDVASLRPDDTDPGWARRTIQARAAFRDEHRHAEDEVRFFASGRGCFYLHLDRRVLAIVCQAGDLLAVPAGTRHWFDMGERPDFVAIRFFEKGDGWIGDFTDHGISAAFPTLDELLAAQ